MTRDRARNYSRSSSVLDEHFDFSANLTEELQQNLLAEIEELQELLEQKRQELAQVEDSHTTNTVTIDYLLAGIARACSNNSRLKPQSILTNVMRCSSARAKNCLDSMPYEINAEGDSFLEKLFRFDIFEEWWSEIIQLSSVIGTGSADESPEITIEELTQSPDETLALYVKYVDPNDTPSVLTVAGFLASFEDPHIHLSRLYPPITPYDPSAFDDYESHFLSLAFAIDCSQRGSLLESIEFDDPNESEWLRTAPWLLPLLNGEDSNGVSSLLSAIGELELSCIRPDQVLSSIEVPDSWIESIRNIASAVSRELEVPNDGVFHFEDDSIEIVLSIENDTVYAWVGSDGEGILTSFDTHDFVVVGLPHYSQAFAAGAAIAWFIDCSMPSRSQKWFVKNETSRTLSRSRKIDRQSLGPSYNFTQTRQHVASGRMTPPTAHYVAAFIRHLIERQPNEEHVAEAPLRLIRRMGPQDTWVRGHMRGQGNLSVIIDRLNNYSMLADALGMLDRRRS